MAEQETLPLDRIATESTQARAVISETVIGEYAEALERGDEFPPIDVYYDGKAYWLADGFHRLRAAARVGQETIAATVHPGGNREALLHALGANETHGHRRTDADRRHAVILMLNDSEWSVWGNREIARRCHVSDILVGRVRRDIEPKEKERERATDETRKVKRGGKVYTMRTGNIGSTKAKQREAVASAGAHELSSGLQEPTASLSATVSQIASDTVTTAPNPEQIVTSEIPPQALAVSEPQKQPDAAPPTLAVGQGEDTATDTPLQSIVLAEAWDVATHDERQAFVAQYRDALQTFLASLPPIDSAPATSAKPEKRRAAPRAKPASPKQQKQRKTPAAAKSPR